MSVALWGQYGSGCRSGCLLFAFADPLCVIFPHLLLLKWPNVGALLLAMVDSLGLSVGAEDVPGGLMHWFLLLSPLIAGFNPFFRCLVVFLLVTLSGAFPFFSCLFLFEIAFFASPFFS